MIEGSRIHRLYLYRFVDEKPPSLREPVVDGHRRKPMVTDEANVQKKTKDNVIRKRKNPRRRPPFRLLGAHCFAPIFLGFAVLKTILNLR